MDCAKGIGVVAGNGGHILDFEGVDEIPNPGPPLIFIPTTAGTSADVSQFAIITDTTRRVKITLVSKMVIPDLAIVDPATTRTMSPELTADTGMDALCHAFEAMVSTTASPLTEMAALSATRLIAGNLQGAFQNPADMKFRNNMMMASLMAGLAFSNASLGLVHAMAHSLGGALDLSHGKCNAILLEKAVRFNYQAAEAKYDLLAKVMGLDLGTGEPDEKGAMLASGIADLCKALGFNQRLVDIGVSADEIPRLAGAAFKDPCLATNPRPASIEDIEKIFHAAYA
jgi:alcohol dehydrogenase class IV